MKAFGAITIALAVCACSDAQAGLNGGGKPGQRALIEEQVDLAQAALDEVMQVDRDFSALAQTAPMGEAFATYMDEVEGMMISPGEVLVGREAIRAGFAGWPDDLKMSWEPDGGHAAASGDLAVTTGRATRTRNGQVVGGSRYVSVWKKNSAGEWKGVIDIGASDPPPAQQATNSPEE